MDYKDFNMNFGIKLKYYRLLKKLTQEQLAEKIEVDSHYISDVERGTRNITLKTLFKLSFALDVEAYKLFYFD